MIARGAEVGAVDPLASIVAAITAYKGVVTRLSRSSEWHITIVGTQVPAVMDGSCSSSLDNVDFIKVGAALLETPIYYKPEHRNKGEKSFCFGALHGCPFLWAPSYA